jgi:hypothetical protein
MRLGGRVLVDGREVGRVPLSSAGGKDEIIRHDIAVDLDASSKRLRFESLGASDGAETHLRIKRVSVLLPSADAATTNGARA